jgi:hypothetical protein
MKKPTVLPRWGFDHADLAHSVLHHGAMRSKRFDVPAEHWLEQARLRVLRGGLSTAWVGILCKRLRSTLSLKGCAAGLRVAYRLARVGATAPEVKASSGHRERCGVASRNLTVPLDTAWAIRFRVNSFVRTGDLRKLEHKHLQLMREAGVAPSDAVGRLRTLYCLRHTSIMFRLLYGQGIDMLTLARNARTSVQMIERFYASALDGEMNVGMLQSRRTPKH